MFSARAQDYAQYYELINRAEESFILNRDTACYTSFDKAFNQFDPFLKDPYIASQIALSLNDTSKFYEYLSICFEHGMPVTSVNSSPIIRQANTGKLKLSIDSLFQVKYISPVINQFQFDKICMMCYQSDSLKVYAGGHGEEFSENEDETRAYLLDSFLTEGVFPNERLFGISTDYRSSKFYASYDRTNPYDEWSLFKNAENPPKEFELYLSCPYNIIMHSQCFYWEHRALFINAMEHGYIHPKEIAIIEERSIIHQAKRGGTDYDCLPLDYRILYNVYGYNPMRSSQVFTKSIEGLVIVEKNRSDIYLQKYSIDLKKRQLETEQGFRFFFDFAGK